MIRMLRNDDQTQWRALWGEYLAMDGSPLDDAVHASTWARFLDKNEPMHGALALVDDRAVGFVHYVFHRSTWSLSDACYLQDLFVVPDARSKGHGRALIDHVCTEAKAAGSSRIYWQTQSDNETAIALYEKIAERSGHIQFRKSTLS